MAFPVVRGGGVAAEVEVVPREVAAKGFQVSQFKML
jgi:hypothetical protein